MPDSTDIEQANGRPRSADGPNEPPRRRRRVRLRTRISLMFPLVTMVLTAGLAAGSLWVLRAVQLPRLEEEAKETVFRNASILQERLGSSQVNIGTVVANLDRPNGGDGLVNFEGEWYSSNLVELAPSKLPAALEAAVTVERRPAIMRYRLGGEPVTVVGVPIESLGASYFGLSPLGEFEQTQRSLAIALAGAVVLTTVAAAIIGQLWTTRMVLAPLADVTDAAEAIASNKLDTRLDLTDDPDLDGFIAAFNNMAEALQTRLERDARFASDVSHELRSPLMTLSASVEVLQRRRDEMPERAVSALDLLAADVNRFQTLVSDLLEISRFDSGTQVLELTPIRVCQFLAEFARARLGHPVTVSHPPGLERLTIDADKRRLVQVISNLIDNAQRYGGGVRAITVDEVDGGVEIGVEDDGPGVPEGERKLIFERFARGASAGKRSNDGGTGLGLSLVDEHVRLHHGRVWVDDARVGSGARFAFFLPTDTDLDLDQDEEEEELEVPVGAEP